MRCQVHVLRLFSVQTSGIRDVYREEMDYQEAEQKSIEMGGEWKPGKSPSCQCNKGKWCKPIPGPMEEACGVSNSGQLSPESIEKFARDGVTVYCVKHKEARKHCKKMGGGYLTGECKCRQNWCIMRTTGEVCDIEAEVSGRFLVLRPQIVEAFARKNITAYCSGTGAAARAKARDVKVSALNFCKKLLEHAHDVTPRKISVHVSHNMNAELNGAQQRCQQALTHAYGNRSDENSTGRLSRFSSPLHFHLDKVCKEECVQLVNRMKDNTYELVRGMFRGNTSHGACADQVVKKVEGELLGCCGKSCGWDGETCRLWPLLPNSSQAEWQEECCGEFTILKNSTRERMCDSVLNATQQEDADRDDPAPESDEDANIVGQSLLQEDHPICDKTPLSECGSTLQEVQEQTCEGLKGWKALKSTDHNPFTQDLTDCTTNKAPGTCSSTTGEGLFFDWTWKKKKVGSQKCCTIENFPTDFDLGTHTDASDFTLGDLFKKYGLVRKNV